MANSHDALSGIERFSDKLAHPSSWELDFCSLAKNIPTVSIAEIDEKSTFSYQMQQQTNQIIEKSNEQIRLLHQQNEQLLNNQKKLEDLYALKDQELKEAKEEAKKAKRYNTVMLIFTVISMLVAIAAWLRPDILSV